MTSEITTPSRRSVAKGAAWAVPAVAVAAAAPSLAASPVDVCAPADIDLDITVLNCGITLLQPTAYFRITNPAGAGCTVPAGQLVTLDTQGIAAVGVDVLEGLNADADLLFSDTGVITTDLDLAPGDFIDFHIIPDDIQLDVLATWTLTVPGDSASFTQGANVGVAGIPVASVCTTLF